MNGVRDRLAAGEDLVASLGSVEARGSNLIAAFVGDESFVALRHYPEDDCFDAASGTQFYFHAHNDGGRGTETGHIHVFVRPEGQGEAKPIHHLVAIALDRFGRPAGLFTTNRWVTDEDFIGAPQARAHAAGYAPTGDNAPSRVIGALYALYADEIASLLDARDDTIAAWQRDHPGVSALDDHRLEITSSLTIDLAATLAAVQEAVEG